ncbi:hypothetical protein D9M71_801190 [compost metagenome]
MPARPVRKIPAPTTNNPAIIKTTEFEKPANASEGVKISIMTNANSYTIATRSARILLVTNAKIVAPKIRNVNVSCTFMNSFLTLIIIKN